MILKGKKVAVLGLGLEGKDLVNFLLKQGAEITVFDQKPKEELDLSGVDAQKIRLATGKSYLKKGFSGFDFIFRSPGVQRFLPEIVDAEKEGVIISSAIKLFFNLCPAKIIGVTGTKGKGTTSTLIYRILKEGGKRVFLAGNIGIPYLSLLPKLKKTDFVVLELSSFQLIDLTQSPHIAVVLNITVDHLDWHKDRNEYVEAKTQIVRHQAKRDFAVINTDYATPQSFSRVTHTKVFWFSKKRKVSGCYVGNGQIVLNIKKPQLIGKATDLLLRGEHNWENVTAAICAAALAGVDTQAIKRTVLSFRGLEHRLELVRKVNGITFYNDSFATNPQPTIAAINSFSEPLILIAGGSEKGLDYTELGRQISRKGNVKAVVLIGQIAPKIEKALKKAKFGGKIRKGVKNMKEAVSQAVSFARQGDVVLLSPASASFGMFKDYKDRGNQFKEAVRKLI